MKPVMIDTTARHEAIAKSIHDTGLSRDELLGALETKPFKRTTMPYAWR